MIRAGRWCCIAGAGIGALGVLAWLLGVGALTAVIPGQPPMMPNTALGLLLIGVGAALRAPANAGRAAKAASVLAALIVLAVGVATLAEYLLGTDLGIDRALVVVHSGQHPGRPSPVTALALTVLSSALIVFDAGSEGRIRPAECLVLLGGTVAFSALIGMAFGAAPLYRLMRVPMIGVAPATVVALLVISAGMLLERPAAGVMSVVTSRGPGGVVVRRLTIPALVLPPLLGIAVTRVATAFGAVAPSFQVAVLAAVTSVVALVLPVLVALPLNGANAALEESHSRTRDLVELAPDGIFLVDLEGRYVDVNGAGCRMLGYARDEIIGKRIVDLIPPEDVERLHRTREALLKGGTQVAEWHVRRKDGSYLPVEISSGILADGRWQGFVRDISERTRAREEVREAQERLELALEGGELTTWDWNIASGQVVFNARGAEMRGLRPDQAPGHVDTWIEGIHPEDLPEVKQRLDRHLRGEIPVYEAEMRVLSKSGQWIWILDRGKVVARDERGESIRVAGTALDVTARKNAEAALRSAEAKSSGILSMSADAVISIDTDRRITMFNEAAQRTFGYSQAEAIGAPWDMLIPERFRAGQRRYIERLAGGPDVTQPMAPEGVSLLGLRKNGQEFPIEASISKLTVEGTTILTVDLRDVTRQKRDEWEQRFRAEIGLVLATSLDYEQTLARVAQLAARELADFCLVDTVDESGRIQRLDVACRDPESAWLCDALRRGPPSGKPSELFSAAFHGREPLLIEHVTAEILLAWAQDEEELQTLRAVAPISVIAVPLVARGRLLGVLKLFSSTPNRRYALADVRMAEEVAQRAAFAIDNARLYQAATRAIRERDDVLGMVAHDLRNPLGAIRMNAQLLRRREGEAAPESRSPADAIARAASRMDRLIADLLDIARLEAGRLSIEPVQVPTASVVADALDAHRAQAVSTSGTLVAELAPDLPDLWADRERLLQIFENLISNALKFIDAGGEVAVGATPRDGEVVFWVRDNGCGISADDVSHLFDRFWQARKSDRRGAGLGLPIVKGLVEAHGGHIWVESTPGSGTTVFFTVPAATHPADQHREPAPQAH
jgi:PAS domain S-box-containing protein